MGKIEQQAARVNMWSALGERILKIVNALGGWTVVAPSGLALLSGWTALVRWLDNLPFWSSAAAGLLLLALTASAFVSIKRAWAIRGIKRLNLQVLGADCVKFREDTFDFLLSRQESQHLLLGNQPPVQNSEAAHKDWEMRRDFTQRTSGLAAQKFSHRIVAISHMLQVTNIPAPNLWGFDYDLAGIAAYIGAIGELLDRGLIDEARTLTDDKNPRISINLR